MNARHVAPAPEALAARVGYADAPKPAPAPANDADLDTPPAIARAKRYLQEEAVPAIEGQGGDETTLKTAYHIKDIGLSQDCAHLLLLEHYNPRCQPPWSAEDLGTKVKNAYRYGTSPPGVADPAKAFSPVPAEPAPEAPKPRFNARYANEIAPKLDNKWLIHGLVPENGLVVVSAAPNRMKTFVVLDMVLAHCRNVSWCDRSTRNGACLYVSPDGDITNRVFAYLKHHGLEGASLPFAFITEGVNLFDKSVDIEPLLDLAKSVARRTGLPLRSIVIDTLHSVLAGGDENSGQDMGAVLFNGSRLKEETGATVIWVHHTGKDTSKGARGHSSLIGKVDTAMELDDHGVLTVKKQRDGKRGEQFGFELQELVIGQDSAGRDVTSCVVKPVGLGALRAFSITGVKPGSVNAKALTVLQDMTMNGDATLVAAWKADFLAKHYPEARKAGATAFDRARQSLFRGGNITVEGDYAAPVE